MGPRLREINDLRVCEVAAHQRQKVAAIWKISRPQCTVLRTKPSQLGRRPDGLAMKSADLRLQCRLAVLAVLCFCAACEAVKCPIDNETCVVHPVGAGEKAVNSCFFAPSTEFPAWYRYHTDLEKGSDLAPPELKAGSTNDEVNYANSWKEFTENRPWFTTTVSGDETGYSIYWHGGAWCITDNRRYTSGGYDCYYVASSTKFPPNMLWESHPDQGLAPRLVGESVHEVEKLKVTGAGVLDGVYELQLNSWDEETGQKVFTADRLWFKGNNSSTEDDDFQKTIFWANDAWHLINLDGDKNSLEAEYAVTSKSRSPPRRCEWDQHNRNCHEIKKTIEIRIYID